MNEMKLKENMIFEIICKQVIMDNNLVKLYQVETRIINQVVKRNIERFPEEFCFRLKEGKIDSLRTQFINSKNR